MSVKTLTIFYDALIMNLVNVKTEIHKVFLL